MLDFAPGRKVKLNGSSKNYFYSSLMAMAGALEL
jgi:hypothetical protein